MNDERFIHLVESNECLYNKWHAAYKYPEKKRAIWRQIATEMGTTDYQCIRRWTTLRDKYTRECRIYTPSGSGAVSPRNSAFKEMMDFLKPHISGRPTRCNFNIVSEFSQSSSSSPIASPSPISSPPPLSSPLPVSSPLPLASPQPAASPPLFTYPSPPGSPTPSAPSRTRKSSESMDDAFIDAVTSFKKMCTLREAEQQNSTLHGFGQMLIGTIAKMSERNQEITIQRVWNVVMEMRQQPD